MFNVKVKLKVDFWVNYPLNIMVKVKFNVRVFLVEKTLVKE